MDKLWALILAAGEGKRMHSNLPKVLHPLCGRPMLDYIIKSAAELTTNIAIVVGHGASLVRKQIGENWHYVLQEEQLGTGHAVLQAFSTLPGEGKLLILCGDTPLLTEDHLRPLVEAVENSAAAVATVELAEPAGYGRIVRDSKGQVQQIVEDRDAVKEIKAIREINTGTYCFDLHLLRSYLPRLKTNNAQGEYYLTDVIGLLRQDGHMVEACLLDDPRFGLGINNRLQLAEATSLMRMRINERFMINGITLEDPATTYIDADVRIGRDTVIRPGSVIEKGTIIGANCVIGPSAHLVAATVKDGALIEYAVVQGCYVDSNERLGPFLFRAGEDF